ncbi:MAG: LPS export ABC transporter periplasmic protein LptC [Bacteroidia bacterium]|nr:LPS export ABC transporter periplasmic protein LptC [Bacteroidia bacterium]MCX7764091.1 LPS export ABC transporter periplasmic protein LptC [Bacteroidia bacterium]MDW8058196.1 LPS export ABC transporter periplasmic protein LptC [Bacteroidia bacterium]
MEEAPYGSWARVCGLLILLLVGCKSQKEPLRPADWGEKRRQIPLYEAHGFTLEWIDTTGKKIQLQAQSVLRLREKDTIKWLLRGAVQAAYVNQNGDTIETLRSQEAEIFPDRRSFTASKEVFLTTAEGLRLETDYLIWEHEKNLITAPDWVRLETPKEVLRGEGLEYRTDQRTYRLRRTRGRIQSPLQ